MDHFHFGCYGLIMQKTEIALVRKARGPYKGLLDLPGGTPDFGESPKDTVIREIGEELGLQASDPILLYEDSVVYNHVLNGELCHLHHIGLIFKCSIDTPILSSDGDGIDSNGGVWSRTDCIVSDLQTPFAINAIQHIFLA